MYTTSDRGSSRGATPGAGDARHTFFEELASRWDEEVATEAFMQRLRALIAGLGIGEAECVVDLGCGTGNLTVVLTELLSGEARVIAVDYSEPMLEEARLKLPDDPRVEWIHADAGELPLPDGGVDRVICLSAWPHFDEPARVAAELYRIVRPGGLIEVLHLEGRATINALHQSIGGPVADDILPPAEELEALLVRAGFEGRGVIDEPDQYRVTVARPVESVGHR